MVLGVLGESRKHWVGWLGLGVHLGARRALGGLVGLKGQRALGGLLG